MPLTVIEVMSEAFGSSENVARHGRPSASSQATTAEPLSEVTEMGPGFNLVKSKGTVAANEDMADSKSGKARRIMLVIIPKKLCLQVREFA